MEPSSEVDPEASAILVVDDDEAICRMLATTLRRDGDRVIETAFTALVIQNGMLPPTINLDNPSEECDLDYVPNVARKADVEFAMTNSFGFGGTNATLILRKYR